MTEAIDMDEAIGKLHMQKKILNLFSGNAKKNFVRVNVFDDFLSIAHIKNGVTSNKSTVDIDHSAKLLAYLHTHITHPIEIVIGSSAMSCKSVPAKKMTNGDVRSLAIHTLDNKKHSVNTIFYGHRKIFASKEQVSICEALISPKATSVLNELLLVRNPIHCITVWPIWVVSTYFDRFLEDENKFACSLFIVERNDSCEIIGYNAGGFVCYRQGLNSSTNKKVEIEETIRYLSQFHKISSDDVAIYVINEDVLDGFVTHSNQNMSMISNVIDDKLLPLNCNVCKIANISMLSISSILLISLLVNTAERRNIIDELDAELKIANSIDKKVLDEAPLWQNISDDDTRQPDLKEALIDYIKGSQHKILQSVALQRNQNSAEIEITAVFSE